ncbi:MAG: alpha/beta fold hydrolase [Calditrichales bacterium]|nr:MAG: alpha/beta fold hydrolase [Calditrichales bacterium]
MSAGIYWFIAVLVIIVFGLWIILRYLLYKAFHHAPVKSDEDPANFGLDAEEHFLQTHNNKKIQTYFIAGKPHKPVIIAVHGWENTVDKFFFGASLLSQKGYSLLLINTRNHGKSDTDSYSTMIKYAQDIDSGIRFIQQKYGDAQRIVLMGHSLGGATVLYKTANDERVSAVVAIASFSDMKALISKAFLAKHFPVKLLPFVIGYIERGIGEKMDNLSPLQTIQKIKQPVFLTHGSKDKIVPISNFNQLIKIKRAHPVSTKLMEGEDHSSLLLKKELFEAIDQFIKDKF